MRYKADCLTVDVRFDAYEAGFIVALHLARQLIRKSDSVFCMPWGGSPTHAFRFFVKIVQNMTLVDTERMMFVKGDELLGLPMNSRHSGETYLHEHLLSPLNIPNGRYVGFLSDPRDAEAECERVGTILGRLGNFDMTLLGLGHNGHLLFNETAVNENSGVHIERLAPSTISRKGFPPGITHAFTCGLKNIRDSKQIIVIACGEEKCEPVRRLLHEDVSTDFTASILRKWDHATLIIDRAAASKLDLTMLKLVPSSS